MCLNKNLKLSVQFSVVNGFGFTKIREMNTMIGRDITNICSSSPRSS